MHKFTVKERYFVYLLDSCVIISSAKSLVIGSADIIYSPE